MAVNYQLVDGDIALPPITDSSTTARAAPGHIVLGKDATYGVGEFVYTKFTGAVTAGDAVLIDQANNICVQAAQAVKATYLGGLLGIAMATQAANSWGWAMVRGVHDGANVVSGVAAGTQLGLGTTAGRLIATSATNSLPGATERLVTATGGNVGTVALNWALSNGV